MITPTFTCRQDRAFVYVDIYLPSIHCKISNAEFDITPFQFTFHCSPYYLRLQFQSRREVLPSSSLSVPSFSAPTTAAGRADQTQGLCEGKGERATYDIAQSMMTVHLPKAVDGEFFLHLDMPNILIATNAQRKALLKPTIEVLSETTTSTHTSNKKKSVTSKAKASNDSDTINNNNTNNNNVAGAKRLVTVVGEDDEAKPDEEAGDAEDEDDEEEEEEWEEVEETDEANDGIDGALETEFVQMQIGTDADAPQKKGGAACVEGEADVEAKMATKIHGTDSSLLALEGRGGAGAAGDGGLISPPVVAAEDRCYGFNNEFCNVFSIMSKADALQDTNLVGEVVDVKDPDRKTHLDRRQERLMAETEAYDDDAFWGCVNEDVQDCNSEVGELFAKLGRGRVGPPHLQNNNNNNNNGQRAFVPWYVEAFEAQLQSSGMTFVSAFNNSTNNNSSASALATAAAEAAASLLTPSAIPKHAVEEEGEEFNTAAAMQSGNSGVVLAWEGNTGTVVDPVGATQQQQQRGGADGASVGLLAENEKLLKATAADVANCSGTTAASIVLTAKPVAAATATTASAFSSSPATSTSINIKAQQAPLRLAIPTVPPTVAFTKEEAQLLMHIQPRPSPLTPIPSGATRVCALIVDLLCAFVFDYIASLGEGGVESVWTVTRLSPSLSYLDQPRNVYEALLGFSRRALVYPYLRHWALVDRVVRDVGIILLSGPTAVIKALLGLKHVLDNTEHHHMLSKIYVNPLIGYLSGCLACDGDAAAIASSLQRTALEVHRCMVFEPTADVASGAVVPPHVIDMLCDGLEGAADVADDAAVKAAVDAAAALMAEDDSDSAAAKNSSCNTNNNNKADTADTCGGAASSKSKGLVLKMLNESRDEQKAKKSSAATELQHQQRLLSVRGGAVQYEPLAPFTIGLPIDMEDPNDDGEDENDEIRYR